ncbi:2'-5' RNA ligase family protein [Specibacter cremeus]|uniref:2'-5' RNA ligase family protein n=1 Tax=Specibacter cremeus TaxID=1629051 RepID=UPI000F76D671|nr:2'-5' RNA ligase family protein [Specibacter cremeus]
MPGISSLGAGATPGADGLGVVIALPEPLRSELGRRRASYGGPETAVVPPHITLVSGVVTGDWATATAHVRAVAAQARPFTVTLAGTGSFRPVSPVVFLDLAHGAAACTDLHERLVAGPLRHSPQFSFRPHVTVAHELPETVMDRAEHEMVDFRATFDVTSIGLFDFKLGGWSLREELQLGGAGERT